MSSEALADAAKGLREDASLLNRIADSLDQLTGPIFGHNDGPVEMKPDKKLERFEGTEPPAKVTEFAKDFAEMSAVAQASVFTTLDAPADEPTPSEWLCPKHGADKVRTVKSPRGRVFGRCYAEQCKEFEKE